MSYFDEPEAAPFVEFDGAMMPGERNTVRSGCNAVGRTCEWKTDFEFVAVFR
jgi:hypothetical protein